MANNKVSFNICDTVDWDEKRFPGLVKKVKKRIGQGPFKVVGVRVIGQKMRQRMSPEITHFQAITIQLENKRYLELSGDWFKKV